VLGEVAEHRQMAYLEGYTKGFNDGKAPIELTNEQKSSADWSQYEHLMGMEP
jgi:hypothetical protein